MKRKIAFTAALLLAALALAAQSVKVVSPNGDESWALNTSHDVTWTFTNAGSAKVDIVLRNSGGKVGVIKSQVALKAGTWTWTEVGKLEDGTVVPIGADYIVRIRDVGNTLSDESDKAFTIGGTQPVMVKIPHVERAPGLKFPRIEVSDIGVAPNAEGFAITFNYKNTGNAPWPKASEVRDKPDYWVGGDDGKAYAQGTLWIPPFPAAPGWEQVGYFGGMVTLPTLGVLVHETGANSMYYEHSYSLYGWHVSDKVRVLVNGYKRMGMPPHELTKDLKQMVLDSGRMYDLLISLIDFNWDTRKLEIGFVVNGTIPENATFNLLCYNDYSRDTPPLLYLDKQPLNKRAYSFSNKLEKTDAIQIAKFVVCVVVNADKPGLRIGDVDMRNNMRFRITSRSN